MIKNKSQLEIESNLKLAFSSISESVSDFSYTGILNFLSSSIFSL